MTESWLSIADRKRNSILGGIPAYWRIPVPAPEQQRDVTGAYIHQYLDPDELVITESDVVDIIQHTTTGQWSTVKVTSAFCHRAALAHQLVNCLHEVFFEAALQQAKALDEYFATHQKPLGPLHGLPVSMKDQFHIKGTSSTMGYVGWIGTFEGRAAKDTDLHFESQVVAELRSLGAVFYCKTSVPHTLMAGETMNNIIGYTYNPKNRFLSSGGSSGGEGALVGLRGSPAGFGSDIGGSIRVPAAFNGIFGIRPSNGRLPYRGVPISMDGQISIPCVIGPLASTIRSLKFIFKTILEAEPWLQDPLVVELPWRDVHEQQILDYAQGLGKNGKLAFGILEHDDVVTPDPPVCRAMRILAGVLQKAGHKVIAWSPPSHKRGWDIAIKTWLFDGGKDVHANFALSGEPVSPQISRVYGTEPVEEKGATHIAATNVEIRNYQKEYLDYWNSTKNLTGTGRPVDAFISPLAPFAASRPGKYSYYTYSTIINLLDYTAVAMPVTQVDKDIDVIDSQYVPRNAEDEKVYTNYDPSLSHGAHVGVQVVGRRLQEEKVLAITEMVSSLLSQGQGTTP